MKYFALLPVWDETHVYVNEIPATLKKKYQLMKGVARSADWPDDMVFKFSADRPEGMVLTDWVHNEFSLLLVSDRFKTLVEATGDDAIEYLPVSMADHRGNVVDDKYWILNSLQLYSVMNREKSLFDPVEDEQKAHSIEKLVLGEEFLTLHPALARPVAYPRIVLLREDLTKALEAEGITGVRFRDTEKFRTHDPDDD